MSWEQAQSTHISASTTVHILFFSFGDDERGADPIVGAFRDLETLRHFVEQHDRRIDDKDVYWQDIPLQSYDLPHENPQEVDTIHLVTECGIGNDRDTALDPVALAAYGDLETAERFVQAQDNEFVVVRTIPVNRALPIPTWITGDPLRY